MRRALTLAVFLLLASNAAAYTKFQFDVTDGSTTAVAALSGTTTKVLKACPGATVAVYLTGTSTLATIYSTEAGAAKSNPFTASNTARATFWIGSGTYDFAFSGGGCSTHTWTGVVVGNDLFSVSVTGFGAVCDGSTDDTVSIQAALNVSGPHAVDFPDGTCRVVTTLAIAQDRVKLRGLGQQISVINCDLTVTGTPCIHFNGGDSGVGAGQVLDQSGINGLTLIADNDAGIQKIGLRLTDVSNFTLEDFAVYPFQSNSNSIALQIRGRDFIRTLGNISLSSDQPLSIEDNPDSTIDLDSSNLDHLELHTGTAAPNIKIASGVNITRVSFRDFACLGGNYCIDRNDSATSQYSESVEIGPGRWEQPTVSPAEYTVRWVDNWGFRQLLINGVQSGSGTSTKGYYFRKVEQPTLLNVNYDGTAEALNIDSTSRSLVLLNTFMFDGSTKTTTGMRRLFGSPKLSSNEPMGRVELWDTASTGEVVNGTMLRFGDLRKYAYTVTVPDGVGNRVTIPMSGGGQVAGIVNVMCKGATLDEMGIVGFTTRANKLLSGTTNFGIGNTPGKVTVWVESSALLRLVNQSGESLDCGVSYEWF